VVLVVVLVLVRVVVARWGRALHSRKVSARVVMTAVSHTKPASVVLVVVEVVVAAWVRAMHSLEAIARGVIHAAFRTRVAVVVAAVVVVLVLAVPSALVMPLPEASAHVVTGAVSRTQALVLAGAGAAAVPVAKLALALHSKRGSVREGTAVASRTMSARVALAVEAKSEGRSH
jgi:hypothetical protein